MYTYYSELEYAYNFDSILMLINFVILCMTYVLILQRRYIIFVRRRFDSHALQVSSTASSTAAKSEAKRALVAVSSLQPQVASSMYYIDR